MKAPVLSDPLVRVRPQRNDASNLAAMANDARLAQNCWVWVCGSGFGGFIERIRLGSRSASCMSHDTIK